MLILVRNIVPKIFPVFFSWNQWLTKECICNLIWRKKLRNYFDFRHCEAVIANIAFVQKEAIFQEEERKERIKVTKLSTLSTSSNSSRTISFDEFRSRFKPLLPCSQFRTPHIRTSCGSSFQNVKESYVMWSWFDKSFKNLALECVWSMVWVYEKLPNKKQVFPICL